MEPITSSAISRLKSLALTGSAVALSMIPEATKSEAKRRAEVEAAYQRAYAFAARLLMTCGTATRPRPSTVRRMMRLLDGKGPSVRGALIALRGGGYIHPTKGARSV